MTRLLPVLLAALLVSCEASHLVAKTLRQPLLVPILHEKQERYQHVGTWGANVHGRYEEVPKGLIVDGASVPWFAWWFMHPDGLHRAAALFHDWAYINRGHLRNGLSLSREQCDQAFYSLMRDAGIGKWRAGTAYRCVRIGGWAAWNTLEAPIILPVDPAALTARKRKWFFLAVPHPYAR